MLQEPLCYPRSPTHCLLPHLLPLTHMLANPRGPVQVLQQWGIWRGV